MRIDLSGLTARRLSIGLLCFAFTGSGLLWAAPAQAMPAPGGSAAVCLTPTSRPTKWRELADTSAVSAAERERVEAQLAQVAAPVAPSSRLVSPLARTAVPAQIHVPVYIHIIRGSHRRDRRISRQMGRRVFYILRGGFSGAQDPTMTPTGVIFDFRHITVNRNDRWFHAAPFSRADRQMKRRLHRGRAQALNIYIAGLNSPRLLGFSVFPWQRARHPALDGVTVNVSGLPRGSASGYNLGDTVIHETGHWMGLLHTFEGGCSEPGDGVADTPSEAEPSFTCPVGRNSCPDPDIPADPNVPGSLPTPNPIPDQVTNFMDYSYDTCMNHFTPGQGERMREAFMRFRFGR